MKILYIKRKYPHWFPSSCTVADVLRLAKENHARIVYSRANEGWVARTGEGRAKMIQDPDFLTICLITRHNENIRNHH